jgi:hypothetical protein
MPSASPLYSGTVISRHDEERILDDYRTLLAGEEERLEEQRREIDRLKSIVGGIEGRLNAHRPVEPTAAPKSSPVPSAPGSLSIRFGRPTFASRVRQIMSDGIERDASAILPGLHERGILPSDGNRTKQMQKISNTLVELAKQGDLVRRGRGTYKLASAEASENGAGREGPNLPVQPGYQKPPGEEFAAPRPGHPYDLEGAPGVGTGHGVRSVDA